MIEGFFELKTTKDLLSKLHHDLQQMELHPFDSYLAFNFFVTAEAMLDWCYPGNENHQKRKEIRDSNAYLKITWDLASGAKHFSNLIKSHVDIDRTTISAGIFPAGYFPKGYFPDGYFGGGVLQVHLNEELPNDGDKILSAYAIAKKVLDYWETKLSSSTIQN